MKIVIGSLFAVSLVFLGSAASAADPPAVPRGEGALWENPHIQRIQHYEGTRTCLACHEKEARDFFSSVHYQWKADAPDIVNAGGRKLGKINTNNDFCTNPGVSWIAILKNDAGRVIGNGCSKCHAGLGAKPSDQMTQGQLENIDCLLCHSASYQREVAQKAGGGLEWRPVAMNSPETMLNVARHVGKTSNDVCLRCHVGSGGGINFKRGDLESAHARPTRDFDVHMGSGMQCTQCHKFRDHKILGGGTQFAGVDRPGEERLACEGCHRGAVHSAAALNRHTSRVACTTCHIPRFAKKDATDMHRDWSRSEPVPGEGRFEPAIEFQRNVKPVYAWWNGKGALAMLEDPVKPGADGRVALYKPQGSRGDPDSRIYAFKLHTARLPIEASSKLMLPVQVGVVFRTGKNEPAVRGGAKAYLGREVSDIAWIETERYMGLFHEVAPKAEALGCRDCHSQGGRLDWKALGYKGDPMRGK